MTFHLTHLTHQFIQKKFLLLMVFLRSRIKKRKSEIRDSAFFAKSVSALFCKNQKNLRKRKTGISDFLNLGELRDFWILRISKI